MENADIVFYKEDIIFPFLNENKRQNWLFNAITAEGKKAGEISCIFCSDEYLYAMNKKYLDHDTYTDIITFNYVEDNVISGDLFISIDRIKENAKKFGHSFNHELNRVLIHGILHLIGYDDKTAEDARKIRAKEDFYLTLYSEN